MRPCDVRKARCADAFPSDLNVIPVCSEIQDDYCRQFNLRTAGLSPSDAGV